MEKVVRTNLSNQIFEIIQGEILRGVWKPGSKLPSESELAKSLGVSRMTLRNGIQQCNAVGLTETRVGEGTFVRHFNLRSYFQKLYSGGILNCSPNEINDLRFILQLGSIRLALENGIDDDSIQLLEDLFKQMEAAAAENDMDTFHEIDCQFHRTICRLCKNDLIYMLYDAMESLIDDITLENVVRSVRYTKGIDGVLSYHRDIVASLRSRDLNEFIAVMERTHYRSPEYYKEGAAV